MKLSPELQKETAKLNALFQIHHKILFFRKEYPQSDIMRMVGQREQFRYYTDLYNIARLEVALLEEGKISVATIGVFIQELCTALESYKSLQ
jgi:hypothetical protein